MDGFRKTGRRTGTDLRLLARRDQQHPVQYLPAPTNGAADRRTACRQAERGRRGSLNEAPDPTSSTDDLLFVQQVYDLCGEDDEIQQLLIAQIDNSTPEQIKAELKWDDRKYETVQKRKRRLVIRLMREGKLL